MKRLCIRDLSRSKCQGRRREQAEHNDASQENIHAHFGRKQQRHDQAEDLVVRAQEPVLFAENAQRSARALLGICGPLVASSRHST